MQDIVTIISTVGFPITACVAMGYVYIKEINGMRESISNLDKSIKLLSEHLECKERDKDEN